MPHFLALTHCHVVSRQLSQVPSSDSCRECPALTAVANAQLWQLSRVPSSDSFRECPALTADLNFQYPADCNGQGYGCHSFPRDTLPNVCVWWRKTVQSFMKYSHTFLIFPQWPIFEGASLKGVCHKICYPYFFPNLNPILRPLMKQVQIFLNSV